ncbi:MAG TPA: hypothetical protein VF541_09135, partial [Longimicrobium sp.]
SSEFGTALGVSTSGNDVVGRHLWAAQGQVFVDDARFEGGVGYLFRGLGNPSLGVSAFQEWSDRGRFEVTGPGGVPVVSDLLQRERAVTGVATFTRPRFRSFTWLSLGANLRQRFFQWADPALAEEIDSPDDVGAIATLGTTTASAYDFSISLQDGFLAAATVEGRRFLRPFEGETRPRGYLRVAGRTQAYHGFDAWGYGKHVLALRGVGGADFGSRTPFFSAGGITGDAVATPLSTGFGLGQTRDLFVRGWPSGSQFGDRAVAGTAEWRFPLLRVERGVGLIPVFVNRFWGTAFVDAGTAWCAEQCNVDLGRLFPDPDPMVSVGTELGGDFLLFFNAAYRVRAGVALPVTRAVTARGFRERPSPKLYFTLGQAF